MSDIEDGELLSDEESDCFEEEKQQLEIKLMGENIYLLEKSNYQWSYEQNNNKVQSPIGSFRSEEDCNQRYCFNSSDSDQDYNMVPKTIESFSNSRKRSSNHFIKDCTPENQSIDNNDSPKPKRRILCKYYAAGDCESGTACDFMHGDFPCKFFHGETAVCRAENNCKFSHEPLSDEMKKVLDDFIQEGKEKLIHSAISTIKNASFINSFSAPPKSRPTCLLPTPDVTTGYDPDFSNSYREILNYPSTKCSVSSTMFDIIPNYPIANKGQLLRNISQENSIKLLGQRDQFAQRKSNHRFSQSSLLDTPPLTIFQRAFQNIQNSDSIRHDIELRLKEYNSSSNSNEENIVPESVTKPMEQLNTKIHAPARFIVNDKKNIKIESVEETSEHVDSHYKDELKKLADQIVTDCTPSFINNDKSITVNDYEQIFDKNITTPFETPTILKDMMKIQNSNPEMSSVISIFNDEPYMNESEKMYIEKMKNLDSQTEDILPWNIKRLEPVNKQPYLLYMLKANEIHDNPLADPRLIGHPVLNFYMKKEIKSCISSDNDGFSPLFPLEEEELHNGHSD